MGREKTSNTQALSQTQVQEVMPGPGEAALTSQQEAFLGATRPGLQDVLTTGMDLLRRILGGEPLPGSLQGLPEGITPTITGELAHEAIADIQPFFQQQGLLDSGVNVSTSARVAGDIRRTVAESNLNRLLQLLQLGVQGVPAMAEPIGGVEQVLSQRLAGLRSTRGVGTSVGTTTQIGMNPFLRSFQSELGASLGGSLGGSVSGALKGVMAKMGTRSKTGGPP